MQFYHGWSLLDGRRLLGGMLTFWAAVQGSGKTLAFGLPILQVILQQRSHISSAAPSACPPGNTAAKALQHHNTGSLQALILAPTRELALQVRVKAAYDY